MTQPGGRGFRIGDGYLEIGIDEQPAERGMAGLGNKMKGWAAGLGLGAIIGTGIGSMLNAEQATANLRGQLGATAEEAQRLGKIAGAAYANNFGASLEEVNGAIKSVSDNFGDLGDMTSEEIQKMTERALGISSTFQAETAMVTKAAGQLVKNGLAKDSTEAFDIITKGFQGGLNASDDFLETLNEYSPYFANLGIEGPEALALLSRGLKAGARDTDYIADAFKEFNIRTIDGSKSTSDAFKALGLDAKSTAAAFGAGGDKAREATSKTIAALAKIKDPLKQNAAGVALFGTQWEDTLRQILPSMVGFEHAAEDITGATDEMTKAVGDTGKARIEGMKRSFEGWVQQMAASNGVVGTVISGVSAMDPAMITAAGSMITAGAAMGGVIKAAGSMALAVVRSTVSIVAAVVSTTATVVASIAVWVARMAWMGAQSLVHAGRVAAAWFIAAGPIAWLIAAVAGVVAFVILNWQKVTSFVIGMGKSIGSFFAGLGSAIAGAITTAVRWIVGLPKRAWDALKSAGSQLVGRGRELIGGLIKGLTDRLKDIAAWFLSLPMMVLNWVKSAGTWLYNTGRNIIRGLMAGIADMFPVLSGQVAGIGAKIRDNVNVSVGARSPARKLMPSGRYIVQGIMAGMEQERPALNSLINDLATVTTRRPGGAVLAGGRADVAGNLSGAPATYVLQLDGREISRFAVNAVTGAPQSVAKATDEGRRLERFASTGRKRY